ncbi:MAG: hypothetical protein Q4E59_05970 [Bacteroidales bacterium]|nr:hypothetical protein [Bacteroidales bacterium]
MEREILKSLVGLEISHGTRAFSVIWVTASVFQLWIERNEWSNFAPSTVRRHNPNTRHADNTIIQHEN